MKLQNNFLAVEREKLIELIDEALACIDEHKWGDTATISYAGLGYDFEFKGGKLIEVTLKPKKAFERFENNNDID